MAPPVSGYSAWWDAQAITGLADGAAVTTWADGSGNGHPFNATGGTHQYYSATTAKMINGHPVVYFNGNGYLATAYTVNVSQPYTIFVVARQDTLPAATAFIGVSSANVRVSSTATVYTIQSNTVISSSVASDTAWHVLTAQFNGASSLLRRDGTQIISGNAGSSALANGFVVGNSADTGSAAALTGPVGEVIVYPSALTAPQMGTVEAYLTARWTGVVTVTGTVAVNAGPVTVAASGGPPANTGTAAVTAGPVSLVVASGSADGCVRYAYLALGGQTLQLEDAAAGYFCSMLDLGFPAPRDVVTNRPDNMGAVDRTQYSGLRTVNVQVEALAGAGAVIDEVVGLFGPYLDPAARPVLHYRLDRPGGPERTLTLRAAAFTGPISGGYQRSIQAQFVAADPIARDPQVQAASATTASTGGVFTAGDVPARPLIRVIGPVTAAQVTLTPDTGPAWTLAFLSTFTVAAGHHVDIDTDARTVYADSDPAQPRLASLDWTVTSWQWVTPDVNWTLALSGTATSAATAVLATWQDGYLT